MPTGPGLRLPAREADDKPIVNHQALDRCYECDRCACARSRDELLLPILKRWQVKLAHYTLLKVLFYQSSRLDIPEDLKLRLECSGSPPRYMLAEGGDANNFSTIQSVRRRPQHWKSKLYMYHIKRTMDVIRYRTLETLC